MNKSKKWIALAVIAVAIAGGLIFFVSKEKETKDDDYDFWKETYDILADRIDGLRYDEMPWRIGLQDRKNAEEKDYPDFFIEYQQEEEDRQTASCLSMFYEDLQNKAIEFTYEVTEFEGENIKAEKVFTIRSTDYKAGQFKTTYLVYEYLNGVFDRSDTQEGYLNVNGNEVDYVELPLMKEALEHFRLLLEMMKEEFGISYKGTHFVDIPALCEKIELSEDVPQDIQTKDYFSEVHYNARGYGIVTFLMVGEDEQTASYGTYDVTRQGYGFRYDMNLIPRTLENCFDLDTAADIEKEMVYFEGDTAYIYPADLSDEEILTDVEQGAEHVVSILSTKNESYTDYEVSRN